MQKVINLIVIVMICKLLMTVSGCGEEDTDSDRVVEVPTATFKSATPESGSILEPDQSITIEFFGTPENLTVEPGKLRELSVETRILGPFPIGDVTIQLTWEGGTHTLNYTFIPEDMVLIREGDFQMGSDSENAAEDEHPVHTVFVDSFLMDINEVTVKDYRKFVEETGHPAPDWDAISEYAPTDKHPIVLVSWHDAMAYAKWTEKRLPTEAEWEKAARAGRKNQKYPWGNASPRDSRCNYADKNLLLYWWSETKFDDGYAYTAPVGRYPENDYGLFDMAGNVLEWCLDEYDAEFYTISQDDNPFSEVNTIQEISEDFDIVQSNRVLRGGSWLVTANNVRNSTRFSLPPQGKNITVGFRCVMDLQ